MHVPLLYILSMNTQVADWGQTLSFQMHIQTLVFLPTRNPKKQTAQLHILKWPLLLYVCPERVSVTNTENSRAREKFLVRRQLLGLHPLIYISSHTIHMGKKANKKVVGKEPAIEVLAVVFTYASNNVLSFLPLPHFLLCRIYMQGKEVCMCPCYCWTSKSFQYCS